MKKATFEKVWSNESDEVQRLVRAIHYRLTDDERADVNAYGANAGWPHFTYTNQTVKFYNRHEQGIWRLIEQECEDQDLSINQWFDLLSIQFYNLDTFKNALVWYALEAVCSREIVELEQ